MKSDVLRQRAQPSGLCYMHGPDVLQHYLVTMHASKSVGMIDLTKFVRNHFSPTSLEKHIFEDYGGDSRVLLKSILQPNSIVVAASFICIEESLRLYGPGLVSKFCVHLDFNDKSVYSHRGYPTELVDHSDNRHCMVLIGHRKDNVTGNNIFLLQNWWKMKQFVEVDEQYLEFCDATVFFVKTPQLCIPDSFPIEMGTYAENELYDDKCETFSGGEMITISSLHFTKELS